MFRKKDPQSLRDQTEIVSAILVPFDENSDKQVTEWLAEHGVDQGTKLADRFLSVRASRKTLKDAETVARVEIKVESKMH